MARDLASLLPLNLTIADYGSDEEVAYLSRQVTEDGGGPFGKEGTGDLCYFEHWSNLTASVRPGGGGKFPLHIEHVR